MSNPSLIVHEPDSIEPALDPNYIRCMQYLTLRETGPSMSMMQAAADMGVSRGTLYNWLAAWRLSGLLEQCRKAFLVPKGEEIRAAENELLAEWPNIIRRQIAIAKDGQSDKNSNEAFQSLMPYVDRLLSEQDKPGSEEMGYIEGLRSIPNPFDPLNLGAGDDDLLLPTDVDEIVTRGQDSKRA
jgi:transposase-like protein